MASTSVSAGENHGLHAGNGSGQLIRVILADTQAIFRAGLRKIFALEDDIPDAICSDEVFCRCSDF